MDFTIYVLGDVRLFADTLNGIAMMFTVAGGEKYNLWASNTNSMGLGMGAFLGVLLSLALLVYNAAFRQRFDFRAVIIPLVLYIVLTVPKVTVNVVDAYGVDGVQTVDNIPLGLAFPMSAISGISLSATETLETIFRVPNASFTKITEDGFVMPLKLLHSMRYAGLTMRDAYPNITDSVAEVVKICLTNNEGFNPKAYQNSGNSMAVFYDALAHPSVASRLVKVYPATAPTGTITNCEKSAEYIKNAMESYLSGTVVGGAINLISTEEIKIKNFRNDLQKILASNNGNTGSRMLTSNNLSTGRVLDDIQALTTATNADALAFAQATLFNPQLSAATECVSSSDNASTARCFAYNTTQEQWKERSAAEASGFLSIMRDGQNLLILLSVTLFPIMVLIVVLQGLGGLKVVMSYLLYTISAYMWIPVAAMINWYVQVQLNDELEKWRASVPAGLNVGDVYLSLANAPLFYDAVSKKLALANSVMASVPMICMGLFSGMLMTMNRLADKMNPQTGYDASVNTPQAMSSEPLAKVGSSISFDGVQSVGKQNGLLSMGTLKAANQVTQAKADMESHNKQLSESLTKVAANDIYMSKDVSAQAEMNRAYAKQLGFTDQQSNSFANMASTEARVMKGWNLANSLMTGAAKNSSETLKEVQSLAASLGFTGKGLDSAVGLTALFAKEIGNIMQKTFSDQSQFQNVSSKAGTRIDGQNASEMSSQTSTKLWQETTTAAFKDAVNNSDGYSDKLTKSHAFGKVASVINQSQESYQKAVQMGTSFEVPMADLANANARTGGTLASDLKQATSHLGQDFENKVAKIAATSSQITVNRGDAEAVDFQARYIAAMGEDDQTRMAANYAVLKDLATNAPVNNIGNTDNSYLKDKVNAETADVIGSTAKAHTLNREDIDAKGDAINATAKDHSSQVSQNAARAPAPTRHLVGDQSKVVGSEADAKEVKVKKDLADAGNAQLPEQPKGGNALVNYTGGTVQAAAVENAQSAKEFKEATAAMAADENQPLGVRAVSGLNSVGAAVKESFWNATAAVTNAYEQPVVVKTYDPSSPTQLKTDEVMTLGQAQERNLNISNISGHSKSVNAGAIAEGVGMGQATNNGVQNTINNSVNGTGEAKNPLLDGVNKHIKGMK